MSGRMVVPTAADSLVPTVVPLATIQGILGAIDKPMLVSDRAGRILAMNSSARELFLNPSASELPVNLFEHLLGWEAAEVAEGLSRGNGLLDREIEHAGSSKRVRLEAAPESDWLIVQINERSADRDGATQITVQELLQEREITYRNLLAAYLKLQEVNRQKTVFLASVAHELKTPLAVIKGYYDLLLAGSLGRLTDKQQDILEESKESCERLVRLVSMFLNYSALESGKLVLQLRENDLRDCLDELSKRCQ